MFTNDQLGINLGGLSKSTLASVNEESIGTYYLAENPKFYEPQRTNSFSFYVDGLDDILKKFNSSSLTTDTVKESKVLQLAVKSSSVPHFSIGKLTINRGNNSMHFAGKPEFPDGSLVVHDYIGARTKEILLAWQKCAYDVKTEKVGLASDYKKDAYLLEYTPEHQLVRTWLLKGCWVSGISEGNYDHDTSETKTMDVVVVYDKAYLDFTSEEAAEEE